MQELNLQRRLARVVAMVRSVASRGVVRLVYSTQKLQRLQVVLLRGEVRELEHAESYGLTAKPKAGAECVALFMNGGRSHGLVIATPDRRFRIQFLAEGEVALYDDIGQVVHLKRTGIELKSTLKVRIDAPLGEIAAPLVTISGSLQVAGGIAAGGGVPVAGQVADAAGTLAAFRAAYNTHFHPESVGTVTGPPNPLI